MLRDESRYKDFLLLPKNKSVERFFRPGDVGNSIDRERTCGMESVSNDGFDPVMSIRTPCFGPEAEAQKNWRANKVVLFAHLLWVKAAPDLQCEFNLGRWLVFMKRRYVDHYPLIDLHSWISSATASVKVKDSLRASWSFPRRYVRWPGHGARRNAANLNGYNACLERRPLATGHRNLGDIR